MTRDEHIELARKLGERIAWLRKSMGVTRAELSRRTGINCPNITRIEGGRHGHVPTLETIVRVARGLGVPPSMILCVLDAVGPA